ncbi:MAG: methionyl-tRNA formyltransferase [Brevundimonas diminuta]|nr:methionyl-tRNA formyltransferase [Brevundimonas diminuta]
MRLAFMGTPDFAVPSLAELIASGHEIVAVYSQPPRPKGRGQKLTPSPVHAFAEAMGLPVFTPESMRAPDAPIQRAIMAGDRQTGAQIMRMSEGLDEGAIILSELMDIHADDTAASLGDRMAHVGAALWPRALAAIERGGFTETQQAGEPTYAKKITSAEARIDWTRPAAEVDAHIRGLSPFPGAWFEVEADGEPVRIKALMSVLAEGQGTPGQVLDDALTIACGTGAVRLTRVQRPGKAAQPADEMLRGFPVPAGAMLDGPRQVEKAEPSDRGPQG